MIITNDDDLILLPFFFLMCREEEKGDMNFVMMRKLAKFLIQKILWYVGLLYLLLYYI